MKDLTNYQRTIRFSLAFVWLFTAISVVLVNPEAGYSILATAGIVGWLAKTCVVGGGLLDLTIGVWLILGFQIKICCKVQCCVIIVYSILLTLIEPAYWFEPFGAITKNIPMLLLILLLYELSTETKSCEKTL